jgi:hypothetical protein
MSSRNPQQTRKPLDSPMTTSRSSDHISYARLNGTIPAALFVVCTVLVFMLQYASYGGMRRPFSGLRTGGCFLVSIAFAWFWIHLMPYVIRRRECNELLTGIRYLDAGYEALFFYRQVEDERGYQKAFELLGGTEAAEFITPNSESGGRAPDLLVFDPKTNRFRFVECKAPSEPFTERQPQRFTAIEQYLNQTAKRHGPVLSDPQRLELFPILAEGRWIHIARVGPEIAG